MVEQFEDLLVRILLLAACISFVSFLPFFPSMQCGLELKYPLSTTYSLPQMVIMYLGIKMERYWRLLHPYLDKSKKKKRKMLQRKEC